MSTDSHILTFSCPNRPGIVAAVARALFECGGNIQEAHQYDDVDTNGFFARIRFNFVDGDQVARLAQTFAPLAEKLQMKWTLRAKAERFLASAPCPGAGQSISGSKRCRIQSA